MFSRRRVVVAGTELVAVTEPIPDAVYALIWPNGQVTVLALIGDGVDANQASQASPVFAGAVPIVGQVTNGIIDGSIHGILDRAIGAVVRDGGHVLGVHAAVLCKDVATQLVKIASGRRTVAIGCAAPAVASSIAGFPIVEETLVAISSTADIAECPFAIAPVSAGLEAVMEVVHTVERGG